MPSPAASRAALQKLGPNCCAVQIIQSFHFLPYMFRWTESLKKVLKKGLKKVTELKKVLKKVMKLKKGLKKVNSLKKALKKVMN